MSKIKQDNLINLESILNEAKKYEEMELATLSNDFAVQFYPHFASDKIDSVVGQVGEFLNNKDEESKSFVELISSSEENFVLLIYFFTVKEFTHLGVEMEDKKTPLELFPYFDALVKTGYLAELVEDVFIPEELQKVLRKMASISALNEHVNQIGIDFMEEFAKHEETIERVVKQFPAKK